jgi:tetratricopeptide (TPR) repeat protein
MGLRADFSDRRDDVEAWKRVAAALIELAGRAINHEFNGMQKEYFQLIQSAQRLLTNGNATGAEEMYRRAYVLLEIDRQSQTHHALICLEGVANIRAQRGDYPESLQLYRKALDGYAQQESLREWKLSCLRSLAITLEEKGDLDEAVAAYREVLEGSKQFHGLEHPDTLRAMKELAQTLKVCGKTEEAEGLHWAALGLHKHTDGLESADALVNLSELGSRLATEGDTTAATSLFRRVVAGRTRLFGVQDPRTLQSMHNLASVLPLEEAIPLLTEVVLLKERALPKDHSDTVFSKEDLSSLLIQARDYLRAEVVLRDLVRIHRSKLGLKSERTLTFMLNHGVCLATLGRHIEALPITEEVCREVQRILGPGHVLWKRSNDVLERLRRGQ